jgi:Ca2+-binding EF-hand superfamily protein
MEAFVAFHESSVIRRAILTALAQQTTIRELTSFKELFLEINKSGDGKISRNELEAWASQIHWPKNGTAPHWVDSVFDSLDSDGSHSIEFIEFCAAASALHDGQKLLKSEDALRATFRVFAGGRGKVSISDFSRVLANTPLDELRSLIPNGYLDCDEALDFENFKLLLCSTAHPLVGHKKASMSAQATDLDTSPATDLTVTSTASPTESEFCSFGSVSSLEEQNLQMEARQ